MRSHDPADVLAFVSQRNPRRSRVFALVRSSNQSSGFVGLEAVATISDPGRSDELCAALNQYVYDGDGALGFHARLRAQLAGEPESVSAAIHQILDRVKRSPRAAENHLLTAVSPFGAFPLSACPPGGCPACGQCADSCRDCATCPAYGEACECHVSMPPRTASLIHAAAVIYSDQVHDLADGIPPAIPLQPHDEDLWPVPRSACWQAQDFYRRFARAFEDIARDIEDGREPDPHTMVEEIALHRALDFAADMLAEMPDDFELFAGGVPRSRFDFDFDGLHNVLFQDKDYEAYLYEGADIARPGELEEWFESFSSPEPRNRDRGFRR